MRIVLKKGKQRELILLAKANKTWANLSQIIKINEHYLNHELVQERRSISYKDYETFSSLACVNFDSYIKNKLNDNWGRSKGGLNSTGNTKVLSAPKESAELAELFGIILGDGHVEITKIKEKPISYSIRIAGHIKEDYDYLVSYTSNLIRKLFNERSKIKLAPRYNGVYLVVYGKNIVSFIESKGIKSGNKKKNNQGIPSWIKRKGDYLKCCIRGLMDTDGSIHRISKSNKNLRISFTSHIPILIQEVRDSLIKLHFSPSKIVCGNKIFLSRKDEVDKYLKWVQFRNQKHLKRIERLNVRAPVV